MDAGFLSPSFLLAADFHPSLFLVQITFPIGVHCCVLKAVIQLCISFLLSLSLTFLSMVSLLSVEIVRGELLHTLFFLSHMFAVEGWEALPKCTVTLHSLRLRANDKRS